MKRSDVEILIVDDDSGLRTLLERALQREGYPVATVASAEDACRLLALEPAQIVITDIFMDQMNGLELIRRLCEQDATVRIIAISGGGYVQGENCLDLAARAGALRVFEKPFLLPELLAAIHEIAPSPSSRLA